MCLSPCAFLFLRGACKHPLRLRYLALTIIEEAEIIDRTERRRFIESSYFARILVTEGPWRGNCFPTFRPHKSRFKVQPTLATTTLCLNWDQNMV